MRKNPQSYRAAGVSLTFAAVWFAFNCEITDADAISNIKTCNYEV